MSAATNTTTGTVGDRFCAGSLDGKPVRIEYATARDEDGPFVMVLAVHRGGDRFRAHCFDPDLISDWERECEAAEITADECPGHPGAARRISADELYRGAVLGPVAIAERRAA